MATITTMNGLVLGLSRATNAYMYKTASTTTVAGDFVSLYEIGGVPALPAIPSSIASTCTSTTDGAMQVLSGSTDIHYIAAANAIVASVANISIFDRLHHCGNLSGASTEVQAANVSSTGSFDTGRCSSTTPTEWFLEWYTTTGTSTATANCDVTFTDASTATISVALSATRRQSQLLRILSTVTPTKIIQSVQNVTLSATTGTAGSFGVTVGKRLCDLPAVTGGNYGVSADFAALGMPSLIGQACLWPVAWAQTTSIGISAISLKVIY